MSSDTTPQENVEGQARGGDPRHGVDPGVCDRQCLGAGFERTERTESTAEKIMRGALRLPPHPTWEAQQLDDWTANPYRSRNWQFQHHALRWLAPVRHVGRDGNAAAAAFWLSTVSSWIRENPPGDSPSFFSWVDMADGLRAQELVFGWPLATTEEDRRLLHDAIRAHGEWLANPSHLASGNHALHQNVGLFVVAAFLRNEDWKQLAVKRLSELFSRSFDRAGANDEGAIDYHRMNLSWWRTTWSRVAMEGVALPENIQQVLSDAATFLAHSTRPNGTVVPLGDTHLRQVQADGWSELDYVASGGAQGKPPATTVIAAPNGYVMGRSGWGDENRDFSEHSHYSIRYGEHTSSHQHEDRGSVTFFAGGQDWITDPGSYIYEPRDPFRRYLRSRDAHNVVTIAEREYGQTSRVSLASCHTDDAAHDFTLVDRNYSGVELVRRVVYLPTLDLMVVSDRVKADGAITARQRWHTEPGIKPRYRDSALELQRRDGARLTIQWLGQGERPQVTYGDKKSVQEWVSRKWGEKEAAAGFHVQRTGAAVAFDAILGDSTNDPWSVMSSRVTATSTWLRIMRYGIVWEIVLGDEGVEMNQDERYAHAGGENRDWTGATESTEHAILQNRLARLEQRWMEVSARDAENEAATQHLKDELAAVRKQNDQTRAAFLDLQAADTRRAAALTMALPASADLEALLGRKTVQQALPLIPDPLRRYEVWQANKESMVLRLGDLRLLARQLHQRGYLERSLRTLTHLASLTGKEKDRHLVTVRSSELAMMRGESLPTAPPAEPRRPVTGRVLHVVGKALPETQTGYTLRSQYLAQAQIERGYDVHVVRQLAEATEDGHGDVVDVDGVTYHLPEGPRRGSLPWDEWLQANTLMLHQLVGELRPALLQCHSDFVNHMIARPVADAYGIPLLYESRGFWEESWLSRVETAAGRPLDDDYERYGLPEAYVLRQEREDKARQSSDHVTTLAEVMREHIVERGLDQKSVTVTPNGVQPDEFPVVSPNAELKARLGIPHDAPVVGYISSLVEYEGIDTLLAAFARLEEDDQAWLLIVGDGAVRRDLEAQANQTTVSERIIFTGRVPHEEVLDYYSVIDIFVVPRRDRAVCRLVTPLKPFEAFSTGRAVVVSDVRALREIAESSGAAELFRADDPDSLAMCLTRLIRDPRRRSDMSARGARWVRSERSWAAIAGLYDEPYKTLGIRQFDTFDGDPSQLPSINASRNRRDNSSVTGRQDAVKLLQLHGSEGIPTGPDVAETTVHTGWAAYGFDPVSLALPLDWSNAGPEDRSWKMHLHCWEFMHAPLVQWAQTGNEKFLRWCMDRATSWMNQFSDVTDDSTMAWYDMAIAYRTMVVLTLLRASEVSTEITDNEYSSLIKLALLQRDGHWNEKSFNPRNNHGYYSAVSQTVLGRELSDLPGMTALHHQGLRRLRIMTDGQFKSDGGHSEHSPDYHRMLLEGFDAALAAGLIEDPAVAQIIENAAEALGWMIQPDGCLVQFGDSAQRAMTGKGLHSSSPSTEWILTEGETGRPPSRTELALPQSGYVFIREPAPRTPEDIRTSSYLAFTSAFHSRAHKHCDDNTMVWFEAGQQILVDGGRYRYGDLLAADSPLRDEGFYYSDPLRQYMESCPAHSTVSLDSALHDRRRDPHGSGIIGQYRSSEGNYVIEAETPQGNWTHKRRVQFAPGKSLTTTDRIVSFDDARHEAFLWWHLDGSLERLTTSEELVFTSHHWSGQELLIEIDGAEEISLVRGQESPLRGWRSRKDRTKEPSWSLCARVPIRSEHTLKTHMSLKSKNSSVGEENVS